MDVADPDLETTDADETPGTEAAGTEAAGTEAAEADDSDDARLKAFSWRIGKNLTRRLDQYLVDRVGYLSRSAVQRLIADEAVRVNGRKTKSSYHPREGETVTMTAPPPRAETIEPEPIPLDVVYEDDHFLAINKQSNLIVHPARGVWNGTLVNALIYYGQRWSTVGGEKRPGILHRLDRNTTGVMLVAKSDEAHWRLARQFENRTIRKTYLALVHGIPDLAEDVIDKPIGRDKYVRERQAIRKEEHGGKVAQTRYEVIERFGSALPNPKSQISDQKYALVRLSPKTGRTHQLRVHMAHLGHPIVGDAVYGGRPFAGTDDAGEFTFGRQALHAFEIAFTHPATLDPMEVAAPLAPDIERVLAALRSGAGRGGAGRWRRVAGVRTGRGEGPGRIFGPQPTPDRRVG